MNGVGALDGGMIASKDINRMSRELPFHNRQLPVYHFSNANEQIRQGDVLFFGKIRPIKRTLSDAS